MSKASEIYSTVQGDKGGSACPPVSQVPLIQNINMPKWHVLEWHILLPFNYINLSLKKKVE